MNQILRVILPVILGSALVCCIPSEKKAPARPNIVLILSDDQGWGDLSINGNTNISTPNIDRLAKEGVTFERFYVCPVCSPTRAELFTGRYHTRGGVYATSAGGERLDLDETTMGEIFKSAGYNTAAYGKWHNGMQPPYHPNARGFDDFYGFCSGHWGNYFEPDLEHNGELIKGKGFIIDDLTEKGINFIEKNKNNPFFLYLPFNSPHSPMQVPDQWWEKYKNKQLDMTHRDPDLEDITFTKAALAMCENIDWNVGRIIKKIEDSGLSEKTIIIYLSDNGPNGWRWNGGMKGRKGSTDEGGVRVPMFIKWESTLNPGKTIPTIAGAVDLMPTLADLAGINYISGKPLDGVSLKPLLIEDNPQWEERYIFNYWSGKTSVRSQQFRLDNQGKLFDMDNDPGQYYDVSDKYPEIFKEMQVAKRNWIEDALKELPESDTRYFTVGHPDFIYTQLPARDGIPHGKIIRSNRYPNSSFFTNWESTTDSITWNIDVLADGYFDVTLYYTCPAKDKGSKIELKFNDAKLNAIITEPHDPPLYGMEYDRVPRHESYVKDFKPLKMGTIHLKKGKGLLTLKAIEIPGIGVMDFKMIMFKRDS